MNCPAKVAHLFLFPIDHACGVVLKTDKINLLFNFELQASGSSGQKKNVGPLCAKLGINKRGASNAASAVRIFNSI